MRSIHHHRRYHSSACRRLRRLRLVCRRLRHIHLVCRRLRRLRSVYHHPRHRFTVLPGDLHRQHSRAHNRLPIIHRCVAGHHRGNSDRVTSSGIR